MSSEEHPKHYEIPGMLLLDSIINCDDKYGWMCKKCMTFLLKYDVATAHLKTCEECKKDAESENTECQSDDTEAST